MNHYCIVYEGQYGEWYSYITKSNIIELAKYLNEKTKGKHDKILTVYLTDDYYSTKLNYKVFFQTEYNRQHFLETYEARLLEQYRIDTFVV